MVVMCEVTDCYSLWSVGHGQAHKVTTGQGEQRHDEGEHSIVCEENRQVGTVLDVTEHEQGDKHHPADHQHREQRGLFTRLRTKN